MADLKTSAAVGYETTVDTSLGVGVTTLNVLSTTGSPAVPCYLTVDPGNDAKREVVLATAKTATTFTITRAQDGTADVEHDPGAVVASVPVSAHVNDLHDRVDAAVTSIAAKADDSAVVHLAGAETITGAKTFSTDPTLADGSSALSVTEGNAAFAPLDNNVVQVVSATLTTTAATTATTYQASGLEATITPLYADSVIYAIVSAYVTDDISSGSVTGRFGRYRILNVTDAATMEGASNVVVGRSLVAASSTAAPSHNALHLLGRYTVNSTAARTFRLEHRAGATGLQSSVNGLDSAAVITLLEVRP